MPRLNLHSTDPSDTPTPATAPTTAKQRTRRRLPLLVRRKAAARLCGVSLPTWDRLDAAGKTPSAIRLGGAKLYRAAELAAWVEYGCPPRAQWAALWEALCRDKHR
jgi:predicted DNA-binding transcriptional regulator AlpA